MLLVGEMIKGTTLISLHPCLQLLAIHYDQQELLEAKHNQAYFHTQMDGLEM